MGCSVGLNNGQQNIQNEPNKNLIFLGNPGPLDPGHTILQTKQSQTWEHTLGKTT